MGLSPGLTEGGTCGQGRVADQPHCNTCDQSMAMSGRMLS